MTYMPYLGTFFFSRYPSVALARNNMYIAIYLLSPISRAFPFVNSNCYCEKSSIFSALAGVKMFSLFGS